MKIVVLDGYGLNPVICHGRRCRRWATDGVRPRPCQLLERSARAEVLITNKTVITAEDGRSAYKSHRRASCRI